MLWLPRWFRIARGVLKAGEAAYDYLTHDEISSFTDGFPIDSYLNTEPDLVANYFVTYAEAFPTAYY